MSRFPDLLKRSYKDCNAVSKPLGVAVLIVGCAMIVISFAMWGTLLGKGLAFVSSVLGPEVAEQIRSEVTVFAPGPQMSQAISNVAAQIQVKFMMMTETEQAEFLAVQMMEFFSSIAPLLFGFIVFTAIVQLWYGAFTLLLAIKGNRPFGEVAGDAFAWMLPLLGLGLLTVLVFAGVMVAYFILMVMVGMLTDASNSIVPTVLSLVATGVMIVSMILLWIRLAFAQVVLVQDKTGVVESLRKSFRITKGKFWRILGNLIGVAAMVWIVTFVIQFVIGMIVNVASDFSPYAMVVHHVMTFVALIAGAYTAIFMVRLKESIAGKKA